MQRGDRVGGRFEIIDAVGSGGMGTVFRGRDVRTRRDVAIKVVAAMTAEEAARFAREVQILSSLCDPAVVGYVAHGRDYLVMDWIEGETLRERLDRAPLSAGDAIAIARQLAGALVALHAAGIVHRDVKPANIMLAATSVKLVDFGIARSGATLRVTHTGTQVGTAGYMAPEQARGEPSITGATDMFALGCVLYECLTGVPAFRGGSATALRAMVLLHDPPPVRAVVRSLPAALDLLLLRLLARDPAGRPTAHEALAALGELTAEDLALPEREPDAAAALAGDVVTEPARSAPLATCAVLVALDDASAPPRAAALADAAVRWFTGGAVATPPDAGAGARLALELSAQLPGARIAVACGRSTAEAIERGAALVEQLAIAAAAGERVAGAWLDRGAAETLAGVFAVEPDRGRARLRGPA